MDITGVLHALLAVAGDLNRDDILSLTISADRKLIVTTLQRDDDGFSVVVDDTPLFEVHEYPVTWEENLL